MPRYARNSVVLAKIETTYGTDPVPTGAANAILVSNLSINPLKANNVDRDLVRAYFGGSEQLVGSAHVEVSFDVEFQHSGTAGTAAAWDPLLQACGFTAGSVLTTPARVEHLLETAYASLKSATIYYYDDGVLHKLLGARGSFSVSLNIGERPTFKFTFLGLDGGVTATANASPTLTGFKTPLVVTDPNTGAITLGCTYATGALSAGTEYVGAGFEFDMANDVAFTDLLGTAAATGQSIDLTDRKMSGKIRLDLTAANEVTFMTAVKANTVQSVGLVHGTTAGYKLLVFLPSVQLINPTKEEINGRRLIGFDMRVLPVDGNDEIKIVGL
ncbi:MAG: phage tail tube protein [Thiobacillus sp.]|jgi:hypothetical protein|uniref:phage tail tube protein n=1 Tax=Thiobacillus sp. TaxID=924 RepID=UPI002894E6C9|nr:phage tail tube protein [Thiobacillus sp.]MDT3708172.1 phage tail tube protein [Thiobacillus sp.]